MLYSLGPRELTLDSSWAIHTATILSRCALYARGSCNKKMDQFECQFQTGMAFILGILFMNVSDSLYCCYNCCCCCSVLLLLSLLLCCMRSIVALCFAASRVSLSWRRDILVWSGLVWSGLVWSGLQMFVRRILVSASVLSITASRLIGRHQRWHRHTHK